MKMVRASVCPGRYHREPGTAWHIKNMLFFLIVLETGKSKTMGPADSASGENRVLAMSSHGGRDEGFLGTLLSEC